MKRTNNSQLLIIILTGLSGAGKSVALHAFEDSGFFCIDNLPLPLVETLVTLGNKSPAISRVAIGMDIREKNILTDFTRVITSLRQKQKVSVIFLEAASDVLIRRFKETRRPHPLGHRDLRKAVIKETKLLSDVRREADTIVDTSALTPHKLRKFMTDSFIRKTPKKMTVNLISFGYKYGIPPEADLLFDVRFLPNPYFIEKLKSYPGTAPRVSKFVLGQEATRDFLDRLYPLIEYLLPKYAQEGRNYLTIAVGCTGGRHRSPAIIADLGKKLKKLKLLATVNHRDIDIT